jgi:hypothetical protein
MRQHDRAADHLVGMFGIDTQAHVKLDGFVELGELDLLDKRHGLFDGVGLSLDLSEGGSIFFTLFAAHVLIGPNGGARTAPNASQGDNYKIAG